MTIAVLSGCQAHFQPRPLLQKVLILPYDAFGPQAHAAGWLGPREQDTRIVIHYHQSEEALRRQYPGREFRCVPVRRALFHVARTLRQLPDGDPQKPRVRATFDSLRSFHRDRQTALTASPPVSGRGALRRMSAFR